MREAQSRCVLRVRRPGKGRWKTGHSHNPIVFVNGHRHGLVCSWSLSLLSSRSRTDSDGSSWLFLVLLVFLSASRHLVEMAAHMDGRMHSFPTTKQPY